MRNSFGEAGASNKKQEALASYRARGFPWERFAPYSSRQGEGP